MGGSQKLSLPLSGGADGPSCTGLKLWVIAAEPGNPIPEQARHLFIDPVSGGAAFAPDDLVLLRRPDGEYRLLGPSLRWRSAGEREWLVEELRSVMTAGLNGAVLTAAATNVLAVSFTAGGSRGPLKVRAHRRSARTSFENLLLHVAARTCNDGDGLALVMLRRALPTLDAAVHPGVQALLRSEWADRLRQAAETAENLELITTAECSYAQAGTAFSDAGLDWQSHVARAKSEAVRLNARQPFLPGMQLGPIREYGALGYSIRRLCRLELRLPGFHLADTPTHRRRQGAHEVLGDIALSDRALLDLAAGVRSAHRRIVATVTNQSESLIIRAGLCDEMRAFIGLGGERDDQAGVAAVQVSCRTLDFQGRQLVMAPCELAHFSGKPTVRGAHDITVRVAMQRGDDLSLTFHVPRGFASARSFL